MNEQNAQGFGGIPTSNPLENTTTFSNTSIPSNPTPQVNPVVSTDTVGDTSQYTPINNIPTTEPEKKVKLATVIPIALAILLLIGVVVYFLFINKKPEQETQHISDVKVNVDVDSVANKTYHADDTTYGFLLNNAWTADRGKTATIQGKEAKKDTYTHTDKTIINVYNFGKGEFICRDVGVDDSKLTDVASLMVDGFNANESFYFFYDSNAAEYASRVSYNYCYTVGEENFRIEYLPIDSSNPKIDDLQKLLGDFNFKATE